MRPESLTVEAGLLVAYSCKSLLDHHTDHPLAPEVAEIGIVQRLGGLGSDLRRFADHVLLQGAAFQEFFSRVRLERVRSDRGGGHPAALFANTVEVDCDRPRRGWEIQPRP